MKAFLRGKFIAIQAYLKKIKIFQINSLTLHLQELEAQQQTKPKASRRKDIINISTELHDIETKIIIQRINICRSLFSEKKNKINKPLARLMRIKREKTQLNKIRNEEREIITNTTEIKRIIRQVYAKKLDSLGKMEKFLEK